MRMSTSNIILMVILLPISIFIGMNMGQNMPSLAILLVLGLMGFVAWILLSNKQGARITGPALADAMALNVPAGKARIYVMRKGFVGGKQGMNIGIDDAVSGQMRSGYFMMADVEPGDHIITARMNKQSEKTRETKSITLEAGQLVLVDVGLEMGMVRMKPFFVATFDQPEIRNALRSLKMIAWLEGGPVEMRRD